VSCSQLKRMRHHMVSCETHAIVVVEVGFGVSPGLVRPVRFTSAIEPAGLVGAQKSSV
jgi:hypothetical protein